MYLGAEDALDDDDDDDDQDECHWCRRAIVDGGYGIEGHQFCNGKCADAWWWEWCRE
jgi:hypothetical protein